jgi:L-ribulokinase
MQIYADVTGCTMQTSASDQTCALGAALAASVLAGSAKGGYDNFKDAQAAMTSVKEKQYVPIPENQAVYEDLYSLYMLVHDAFGGVDTTMELGNVMKSLIAFASNREGL